MSKRVIKFFFVVGGFVPNVANKRGIIKPFSLDPKILAGARKMSIDGYIINVDYTDIKNHAAQLGRIGNNVNQIAKRMNQTGSLPG